MPPGGAPSKELANLYRSICVAGEHKPPRPHANPVGRFTLMDAVGGDVSTVHRLYHTHSAQ